MGMKSATVLLVDGHTATWNKKDGLKGVSVNDGGVLIVMCTLPSRSGPETVAKAAYNVSAWITMECEYE